MRKYVNKQKGQSLFELVVAIAISALIIVSIVSLVTNALSNANYSKNNAQAVVLTQGLTEWLRSQRDGDITTFLTNVSTNKPSVTPYCFISLDWNTPGPCGATAFVKDISSGKNTVFIREGDFTVTTDTNGKTLIESDIKVSWKDSKGFHEVENITYFTDWRQR